MSKHIKTDGTITIKGENGKIVNNVSAAATSGPRDQPGVAPEVSDVNIVELRDLFRTISRDLGSIDCRAPEGNAYVIMGRVISEIRAYARDYDSKFAVLEGAYQADATSSTYAHLKKVSKQYAKIEFVNEGAEYDEDED